MCRLDVAMGDIENNTFDRKDNTKKCFSSRTWLISVLVVFFFVAPLVQRDDSDSLHHVGVKRASVGFPGEASFETNKQERESIPEHNTQPTMNTELHDSWEPLEAFNRWKVWHSQQALEEEYRAHKRKGSPLPERNLSWHNTRAPNRLATFYITLPMLFCWPLSQTEPSSTSIEQLQVCSSNKIQRANAILS